MVPGQLGAHAVATVFKLTNELEDDVGPWQAEAFRSCDGLDK